MYLALRGLVFLRNVWCAVNEHNVVAVERSPVVRHTLPGHLLDSLLLLSQHTQSTLQGLSLLALDALRL